MAYNPFVSCSFEHPVHKQNDLLDMPAIWLTDPMKGFDSFIQSTEFVEMGKHGKARKAEGRAVHPISASSQQVYRHMFGSFLRWMESRRLRLDQVGDKEIREFLEVRHGDKNTEGKKLNSLIRVRYLRLLERVFDHLDGAGTANPARKAAYGIHKSAETGRDKPKAFLTEKEQAKFLAHLIEPEAFDPEKPLSPSWKKRRDRAMLAMMLGAGLKVSEVIGLRIEHIGKKDSTGCIPIKVINLALRAADNAHRTYLRPFAIPYVLPWIEERAWRAKPDRKAGRAAIPGKMLFPASLKEGEPLNKATVYRHVKVTMEAAGLDVERMGGRTLRNSFAVTELKKGTPIELVGELLGHYERRSTEKYEVPTKQENLIR